MEVHLKPAAPTTMTVVRVVTLGLILGALCTPSQTSAVELRATPQANQIAVHPGSNNVPPQTAGTSTHLGAASAQNVDAPPGNGVRTMDASFSLPSTMETAETFHRETNTQSNHRGGSHSIASARTSSGTQTSLLPTSNTESSHSPGGLKDLGR